MHIDKGDTISLNAIITSKSAEVQSDFGVLFASSERFGVLFASVNYRVYKI